MIKIYHLNMAVGVGVYYKKKEEFEKK